MATLRQNGFAVTVPEAQLVDGQYAALKHETEYTLTLRNGRDTRCDATVKIDGKCMGKFRVRANDRITIDRPADHARKFTFLKEDSDEAAGAGVAAGGKQNGVVTVTFVPEAEQEVEEIFDMEEDCALGIDRGGPTKGGATRGGGTRGGGTYYGAMAAGMTREATRGATRGAAPKASRLAEIRERYLSSRSDRKLRRLTSKPAPRFDWQLSSGATALGAKSSQTFGEAAAITDVDFNNVTCITLRLVCDDTKKYVAVSSLGPDLSVAPPRVEQRA